MADYTLDQLRSLWEEGSKAGNFAPGEYQTRLSPEGEGGGGQTYEAYGSNPNSILLQNGDPRYSMPILSRLGDEEGGGYKTVTDMLGGVEHVTYSPEGNVIDRQFYNNPTPSHQNFLKLAGGLALGVGGLSALAGAGAAGAGAGGFGLSPEAIASIFSGTEGVGAGLAGGEFAGLNPSMFEGAAELFNQGLSSLPANSFSGPIDAELFGPGSSSGPIDAELFGPGNSSGPIDAELFGPGNSSGPIDAELFPGNSANSPIPDLPGDYPAVPEGYGTEVPGLNPGSGSSLPGGLSKGIADLLKDPRVLGGLAAGAAGAAAAGAASKGKSEVAPVGLRSLPQYGFDREALPIDTSRRPGISPAQRYFKDSYTKLAAGGGIAGLPRNEYKAGGRYLSGPGDGMSDNIKANIDGVQEARLADGEFVIPADVVSHIGNGSSNAGAKRLHTMMARIRQARTGNPKQGKQIKPEKYLPA